MEKERKEDVVEAALFIAGRFLSIAELVVITGTNPITLREILARLKEKYADGAIILIEKNGEYKMDVEQEHSWLVNRLASGKAEFSKAEQETLAIIAHKQPITQATVVKVRSNKAYDHIKHLLQAGLIKAKKFKNTLQLELSESFHDYFRLGEKGKQEKEEEVREGGGREEGEKKEAILEEKEEREEKKKGEAEMQGTTEELIKKMLEEKQKQEEKQEKMQETEGNEMEEEEGEEIEEKEKIGGQEEDVI